jgi:hypothetical protein
MSEEEQGSVFRGLAAIAEQGFDAVGKLGIAAGEASLGASEYGVAGAEHLLATGAEYAGARDARRA